MAGNAESLNDLFFFAPHQMKVWYVCNLTVSLSEEKLRAIAAHEVERPSCGAGLVKLLLITHELQPALAGDTALEGFVPRPTRGVGSWRRDRISG